MDREEPGMSRRWRSSDLHNAYLAGDIAAFHALFDRYSVRMLAWASYYLHDAELARDAAQDSWLAILRSGHRVPGRFRSWVFSIVANRARSLASREGRRRSAEIDAEAGGSRPSPPPFERVALSETVARLGDALRSLPAKQRRVFVLRDVAGMTSDDVCKRLALSAENQRVLLHRARTALREAISQSGKLSARD